MTNLLKKLWTSPNTLLGKTILRLIGGKYKEKAAGHYAVASSSLMQKYMNKIGISAITFGQCVIYGSRKFTNNRYKHECMHVEQYERWGPLFLLMYGAASVVSRVKHGDWYKHNHFECKAREQEV